MKRTFQIVGANESDPASGKLSHASPVGRAVLKRRVGDKVTVSTSRRYGIRDRQRRGREPTPPATHLYLNFIESLMYTWCTT